MIAILLGVTASLTQAQVSVSQSGTPTYSIPIPVPPGIAGLQPALELSYTASGVNGPQGYNWGLQGLSMITRCPATKAVDGRLGGSVRYTNTDQLCLDGERLIRINAGGGIAISGFGLSDALGLTNGFYEYRTERDSYARIRAYGAANGMDIYQGPAYFKVWTNAGQIYEYGAAPSADANTSALITAQGKTVPMAWAVGRISDLRGNYIDFKYEQRDQPWGTGTVANAPVPGSEWNIREIQYTGNASQAPTNKIVFVYSDRLASTGSEAYHMGSKTVSVRQLDEIRSYINSPNAGSLGPAGAAVLVRTQALSYQASAVTSRLLLQKVTECTDLARTRCMPATKFSYTAPPRDAWGSWETGDAFRSILASADHKYGVLMGDYDGDGRTDLLRWSETPSENKLFLSSLGFNASSNFNIADQNLSHSNGCYKSYVADFNGDGLSDIFRWSCGTSVNYLYLSNGSGAFARNIITGVELKRKKGGAYVIPGAPQGGSTSVGYSERANFYLLDVNDDGLIDVIQHRASAGEEVGTVSVFRGDGKGEFVSIDANIQDLYSEPVQDEPLNGNGHLADVDGDGLMDIVGVGLSGKGAWRSLGNGRFQAFSNYEEKCLIQIDFNGDGRVDCVTDRQARYSDGNEGYKTVPYSDELYRNLFVGGGSAFGFAVADLNGDGCADLIRWADNKTGNSFNYSNCNGSFTKTIAFYSDITYHQLKHTNGVNDFLVGDFLGRGSADILLLTMSSTSTRFFFKADATPPDLLLTVANSLGRKTSLVYVPLSNSSSGAIGLRYASDRGTSFAAVAPKIDLVGPRYVVALNP